LYTIDSTQHSPLIGFAYDGFPIYGAYGFRNMDGTGGVVRIKSGYQLRSITTRTTSPTGASVSAGPAVSTTYPLGYFREDYEFVGGSGLPDVLDEHNGRFCVTPEYPNGMYCYFATVDQNWNSAYPYIVGPTFYGTRTGAKVTAIGEVVITYSPSTTSLKKNTENDVVFHAFPNPASELIAVQISGLVNSTMMVALYDLSGKLIEEKTLNPGSTISYFDARKLYAGQYLIKLVGESSTQTKRLSLVK
jgi:hypothetical protein